MPDGELLRLPALLQWQPRQQLLGEVAAHAVAEDRDLRVDVHAGSKPAFGAPCLSSPRSPVRTPMTRAPSNSTSWPAKPVKKSTPGLGHAVGEPLATAGSATR